MREVFLPLGLVDNKVCAIDDTWSGLRVVWRTRAPPRAPSDARQRRRLTDASSIAPMIGVYPGSFDPPTVAHLAVASAAVARRRARPARLRAVPQCAGQGGPAASSTADRFEVLQAVAEHRPWLGVRVDRRQLLADVAAGYDVVVMGADKWAQVLDPVWYGSLAERDDALARLPRVLVAPRAGDHPTGVELLMVPEHLTDVSSTAARAGQGHWLLPEARAFAARTGVWSNR